MNIRRRNRTRLIKRYMLTDVQTNQVTELESNDEVSRFTGYHKSVVHKAGREGLAITSRVDGRTYRFTYATYRVKDVLNLEIPRKYRHRIEPIPGEEWRTIPGHHPGNMVSSMGRFKFVDDYGNESLRRIGRSGNGTGRYYSSTTILNPDGKGYDRNFRFSRIMARAFIDPTFPIAYTKGENWIVDHINNDPLDDRLSNLRIVTQAENIALAYAEQGVKPTEGMVEHGKKIGDDYGKKIAKPVVIVELNARYDNITQAAYDQGVNPQHLSKKLRDNDGVATVNGLTYKYTIKGT